MKIKKTIDLNNFLTPVYPKASVEEVKDEEAEKNRTTNPVLANKMDILYVEEMEEEESGIWVNAKLTYSQQFHQLYNEKKKELSLEEMIPEEYHEFLDVFDKKKADWFPESRVWDHKIEMKEGFEPKSFKTYNLTPAEQIELDKFLKGKSRQRLHSTITISHGFPFLLCQ